MTKLEKELVIKNRRILQLEGLVIQLGGTIPPDDENLKALEEPDISGPEHSQDTDETEDLSNPEGEHHEVPEHHEESAPNVKPEGKIEGKIDVEESKKQHTGDTTVKVISDQVDTQKNKEKIDELESQKKEMNADVDTLFTQLKQERKKLKIKDLKLTELKVLLKNSIGETEYQKRENEELKKLIVDLRKKSGVDELQPELGKETSTQSAAVFMKKLLDDVNIPPKVKAQIESVGKSLNITASSSISISKKDDVNAETTVEENKKGKTEAKEETKTESPSKEKVYSTQEMKAIIEQVSTNTKKLFESEKEAMQNKIVQLTKTNEELKNNAANESQNYKFLEGIVLF